MTMPEEGLPEWKNRIDDKIAHTDVVVGELKVGQLSLERGLNSVNQNLQALAQEFRTAIGAMRKDFPLATVFSGMAVCLSGAVWIGNLMTTPLRDQQAVNTVAITSLQKSDLDTAHWQGRIDGLWEERTKWLEDLIATVNGIHQTIDRNERGDTYTLGRVDAMAEVVRDIDMAGSRKWVKPSAGGTP